MRVSFKSLKWVLLLVVLLSYALALMVIFELYDAIEPVELQFPWGFSVQFKL